MSLILITEEPIYQEVEVEFAFEVIPTILKNSTNYSSYQEYLSMRKLLKRIIFLLLISVLCIGNYTVS